MTLSYDASLDDITEPHLRQYFRTSTARNTRTRSVLYGAIIIGAAIYFVARESDPTSLALAVLFGAAVGSALNFFTFRSSMTKRFRKHLSKETEGRLPARTIYSFEPGHIKCSCLGAAITFSLLGLESITEDEKYLELRFENKGLCTIPLRVFSTPTEKDDFLQEIKREQSNPDGRI